MFGLSELVWGWVCAGALCVVVALSATVAVQHAHNVTLSTKLDTASANEAANKKSADQWQKVATDQNTSCELYKAQQVILSANNASALAAAETAAKQSDAKLVAFEAKYHKALTGSAATLLNTPIPVEALP